MDQQAPSKDAINHDVDLTKLEALVTPEQERSASVAKKRRTFTKRRSLNAPKRDATPLKEINNISTDEEDTPVPPKPKTPDRKRRKRVSKTKSSKSEPEITDYELLIKEKSPKLAEVTQTTKDRLTELAQTEISALITRTKKSLTSVANRGRDRFKKINKEDVARSQSAPQGFTQEELTESFRKAQLLRPNNRKYSDSSAISTISETVVPTKPFRSEVREFVRERKKKRRALTTEKIVEILDPKIPDVTQHKACTLAKPDFKLSHLFHILRFNTVKELRLNYKLFKTDNAKECRKIRILRNRCMCELFLILVFCGFGGFIFRFFEGSFENFYKCGVKQVKRDFIDLLWIKSHNLREEDWKSLARNKLRNFEEQLHNAHEAGVKSYSGQRSWSFLNAVVYCLSIVTTIGYGHIYPDTRIGKAFTIIYAVIGIPLFLLALTDFGKLFTRAIKFLWSFVRRVYYTGSCRRVRKQAHMEEIFKGAQMMYEIATFRRPSMFTDPENPQNEDSPVTTGEDTNTPTTPAISTFEINDEFNLPISLALFILILYILLGAVIYMLWEKWDFFKAFYFVFISMSTVGFGDVVPDDAACMIVSIVYLVFGLALMSMCINVVQEKLSDTFKQASTKIGATIGVDIAEDDGSVATVPPETVEMPKVHNVSNLVQNSDKSQDVQDKEKDS